MHYSSEPCWGTGMVSSDRVEAVLCGCREHVAVGKNVTE